MLPNLFNNSCGTWSVSSSEFSSKLVVLETLLAIKTSFDTVFLGTSLGFASQSVDLWVLKQGREQLCQEKKKHKIKNLIDVT